MEDDSGNQQSCEYPRPNAQQATDAGVLSFPSMGIEPHIFVGGAVLLALTFLVYFPSLGGSMVWDDTFLVGENPFFRSPFFLLEVFRQWLWIDPIAAYYRPVQNWSYIVDYLLWGEWFPGYRLTSLVGHAVAAMLLWRLLRQIFIEGELWLCGRDLRADTNLRREATWLSWLALFCAVAWLVHPAHSAAVAYVSGRADSLAAVLALSGWLLWRRAIFYDRGCSVRYYLLTTAALVCLLLSLCSRETGLLWLLVFVAWEGIVRWRGRWLHALHALVSGGILVALYVWLRTLPPDLWMKPSLDSEPTFSAKVFHTLLALGDYASLFLAPFRLSMERSLDVEDGAWMALLAAALILLALLFVMMLFRGPGLLLRRFFALWFCLGFLAISPVFARNATVAEHWMYFPYAGLLAGLTLLGRDALNRKKSRGWCYVCTTVGVIWVALLGIRLFQRASDWTDNTTFMSATLEYGESTSRIQGLVAANLARSGRLNEAEAVLLDAIRQHPKDRLLKIYLASVLEVQGRLSEALPLVSFSAEELSALRGLHPLVAQAPLTRARILVKSGETANALATLREAADIWPSHWPIHASLAALLNETNDTSGAIDVLARFQDRNPWHLEATMQLSASLSRQGNPKLAVALLEKARLLDVRSPEPDRLLAGVHADHQNWSAAILAQKRALARSDGASQDVNALKALADAAVGSR